MDHSLAGKFLIAMPGIGDPRFEQAVILVCLHTPNHAMGLIVNKPKDELTLGDVLDRLGIEATQVPPSRCVLNGGPVKQDRGYVLHSEDFATVEATQSVAPGISLTVTRDVLEALASPADAPSDFVLALGYAGWAGGQLEQELLQNVWLVADVEREIVFDQSHEEKWSRAIRRLGLDPIQLTGAQGNA